MELIHSEIFWIAFWAISEIIALSPLKSNSMVELVLSTIRSIKPSSIKR